MSPVFRYDDYQNSQTGTIIDLLRERGAIDAGAAERIAGVRANADVQKGNAWAGAIQQAAQLPAQVVEASRARSDRETNRQVLIAGEVGRLAATANGNPDLFKSGVSELARMGVMPKEMAAHIFQQVDTEGPAALQKYALFGQQIKQAVKTRPVETTNAQGERVTKMVPEDDTGEYPVPAAPAPRTPTRTVRTIENGVEVEKIVPDEAGATYVVPPPPKPEAKRYTVTVDDGKGNPIQKLVTEEEMAKGVPAYRAPKDVKEPPKFWVMRDGNPIRVSEDEYRAGDKPASTREQGRPVTAGNAEELADFDTSLDDLSVLRAAVAPLDPDTGEPVPGVTGVSAQIGAAVPAWVTDMTGWGTDAKKKQALIDRVKQVIGKTLEGGVLRKEDEIKYEKILPTIKDTNELVVSKLAGLEAAIAKRKARRLDAMEDAGYDVSKFRDRAPAGDVRSRVRDILAGAGKSVDDASIDQFLKNNPGFK